MWFFILDLRRTLRAVGCAIRAAECTMLFTGSIHDPEWAGACQLHLRTLHLGAARLECGRMRVAWISFFPIEWLPELPEELRGIPRLHPAPWQRTLLRELKAVADLELHIFSVRKHFKRSCVFRKDGVTFHCIKVPGGMRALSLFWWETFVLRKRQRAHPARHLDTVKGHSI